MKSTKTQVNYRRSDARENKRCGNCIMFRAPDQCTLVAGIINKTFVCDRWSPKSKS